MTCDGANLSLGLSAFSRWTEWSRQRRRLGFLLDRPVSSAECGASIATDYITVLPRCAPQVDQVFRGGSFCRFMSLSFVTWPCVRPCDHLESIAFWTAARSRITLFKKMM